MAYTSLDICNTALMLIGEKPINSINDDSTQARTVKRRYRSLIQGFFAKHRLACSLQYTTISPDGDYITKIKSYDYRFSWPTDALRVVGIYTTNDEPVFDFVYYGRKILCDANTLVVEYVRDLTDTADIPPDVGELLGTYLAWDICERLRPDNATRSQLWSKFMAQRAEVLASEAQDKSPNFYGTTDPFLKQKNFHPYNWTDIR